MSEKLNVNGDLKSKEILIQKTFEAETKAIKIRSEKVKSREKLASSLLLAELLESRFCWFRLHCGKGKKSVKPLFKRFNRLSVEKIIKVKIIKIRILIRRRSENIPTSGSTIPPEKPVGLVSLMGVGQNQRRRC